MKTSLTLALGGSVLLHGLVLGLLWLKSAPPNPNPPDQVQIELVKRKILPVAESPPEELRPAGNPKRKSGAKARGHSKGLGRFRPRGVDFDHPVVGSPPYDSADSRLASEEFGADGGNFGEIVNFLRYEKLQEVIEGLLFYPGVLGRRGMEGTINARLALDSTSHCDWGRTKIDGSNPYLKVYILALLKKLCGRTAIEQVKVSRIDLSFRFYLKEYMHPTIDPDPGSQIVGNVLTFARAFPKSKFEYHIGPIQGIWFVPYVTVDFPWIFEKWDKYVNNVDPMADFRGSQ
ncbi:MAG: hypothetical protein AB7F86_15255 [Bdellovibrionales bacterium]